MQYDIMEVSVEDWRRRLHDLRLLFCAKEIWRSCGCAFFMQKEHFVAGESDRDDEGRGDKPEAIEIQAVGVPERKALGEAVEAAFLAKATMLGFPVLKPWGDSRPYDFAVESGRRLWRVQVKCATSHRGTRCGARASGSGG